MSNNCLVTKLKGEVQNDNLPRLGIASFDVKKGSGAISFQIASPTASVHVKSKIPFTPYSSSTKVYEYTTTPGMSIYGTIVNDDIPGNVGDIITDAIECDNMYSTDLLYIDSGIQMPMTERNNLKSAYKHAPVEIVSISANDGYIELNNACYYLNVPKQDGMYSDYNYIEDYLDSDTLEVIRHNPNGGLVITKDHSDNTHFKYLFAPISGNVLNLPLNIEYFGNIGGSGEIVNWVEKMRSKGRTSGFCTIVNCEYGLITYNGSLLQALIENNTVHNFGTSNDYRVVLTWDADNITWATTLPEGAITKSILPSVYYIQKHSA